MHCMNSNDLFEIIRVMLPNVNDLEMIYKSSILVWLTVTITKTGLFILLVWFLTNKIGLRLSIGASKQANKKIRKKKK